MGKKLQRLNIIGCGHVGKTLGRLWTKNSIFEIGEVLNRSIESSITAAEFIGAGNAIATINEMTPADVFMISTSDSYIIQQCNVLAASNILRPGNLVFHCSGAISSIELVSAKHAGAITGSVHPVKSFANPEISVASFNGTYCGIEGDANAVTILESVFQAIGGKTFVLDARYKVYYHAATVIVCNYLTSLLEFGIQTYMRSGLKRDDAREIMEPIVRGTVDNIFTFDTVRALTGPIARGDFAVVSKQLDALGTWNVEFGELYRRLGIIALDLSEKQKTASEEAIMKLAGLLKDAITASPQPRNA